ncbi:hypothetical protein B0J11DRAFT_427520 [Dendryphion nanum]|uniref:Uncharacterized protein n=1 Tax=Dendryphion nanum TaxID=256645 RepID=A0A9P9E7M8_9PLEO|nr:hypothetical protein B0J11DRAFT_427520 [Dendryphion nanum]
MRLPKPLPEDKRQLDVLVRYGSAFHNLTRLDQLGSSAETDPLPIDHHPQPSADSSLTAFAQLACIRLGATRALISLIDEHRQHVLAEATPDLNLRAGSHDGDASPLWLGSVTIPRKWGLCEQVVEIDPQTVENINQTVVVINDLAENSVYRNRTYVTGAPHMRFFAGAALVSPKGAIVGALCVFDDKPRDGLPVGDSHHLQDLASTVMEYLDTYTIKAKFKRGEQLTRALLSFAEGHSAIQSFSDDSSVRSMPGSASPMVHSSAQTEYDVASRVGSTRPSSIQNPGSITSATSTLPQSIAPSTQQSSNFASVKALQESILPFNSRLMFARAARLIQASSNLDGVLLLDASVAGVGKSNHAGASTSSNRSQNDSSDNSSTSIFSSSDESDDQNRRRAEQGPGPAHSTKTCQILGYATPQKSDFGGDAITAAYRSFPETDLTRLLRIYPNGKVLNFTRAGEALSTDDSEDSAPSTSQDAIPAERPASKLKRKHSGTKMDRLSKALRELLPEAQSIAFVPFWDYERSRWFAGCLCWSNRPERQLSDKVDLAYFKVFSHSIMTELSRLDALASSQAKTSFVASISHELRSPLHGILGTLEFFKDTHLDSFQLSMLNSLAACGQTLLDTINHVLDYSKGTESAKNPSFKRLTGPKTVRLSSKPLKARKTSAQPQENFFDLAIATEEVVEASFSGTSYTYLGDEDLDTAFSTSGAISLGEESMQQSSRKRNRYVVLDIAHEADWNYCVPPGSWRRVLMNLLGNALKYTDSGHIRVSLCTSAVADSKANLRSVVLGISDSGRGMGTNFLANAAFQPFTQENPHSAGTGLGLSIVRQIIESIGGKIEITSDHLVGTDVVVKFLLPQWKGPLNNNTQRKEFDEILPVLQNRRVSILHKTRLSISDTDDIPDRRESLSRFTDSVAATLTNHLKMDVNQTTDWTHDAEIVICPEVSFDYLHEIRRRRSIGTRAPVTIFIATDAIEAAALRTDARITNNESIVEIITQPCGPMKLAVILNNCFKRFEASDENVWPPLATTMSPLPGTRLQDFEPSAIDSSIPERPAPTPLPTQAQSAEFHNSSSVIEQSTVQRVLITDDNTINRRLLVAFLKRLKVPHGEAQNGLEALLSYQEAMERFDVILMDISMPVMDGMAATRAIREYEVKNNVPRAYIIALTGLASASARLEAWSSGVDQYMTKPVDFKLLEQHLKDEELRKASRRSAAAAESRTQEERNNDRDEAPKDPNV